MAKGSTGVGTNVIVHVKKAERIPCDCSRCKHSRKGAGTIYCSYYDLFSPDRKTCARYWCVKPLPRKKKAKRHKDKKEQ